MDDDGDCLECGDPMVGPAVKCYGCSMEACDAYMHHGLHIDHTGEPLDMYGTSVDPSGEPGGGDAGETP